MVNSDPLETTTDHHHPLTAGLSVSYALNERWSLRTGINYNFLSSDFSFGNAAYSRTVRQQLHYIGCPLMASYSFYQTKNFRFYVTAGAEAEKLISGTRKERNRAGDGQSATSEKVTENRLQFSTLGAAGAEYRLGRTFSFFAEPGVSYHFDNGSTVDNIYKAKPLNFHFNIGLRFHIGKAPNQK